MDSNFQVTITANIQDLVSRVSAIEKELGKISSAASSAGKGIKTSFDSLAEDHSLSFVLKFLKKKITIKKKLKKIKLF